MMFHQEENQAHLGDLKQKSLPELKELLQRQKNLLSNQSLVRRLPDKGSKIHSLCACLESLIETRSQVDQTADLFHSMSLAAETARSSRGHNEKDETKEALSVISNNPTGDKVIIDERGDESNETEGFVYSYKHVVKPAERKKAEQPDSRKFIPNRSLKNANIDDSLTIKETSKPKQNIQGRPPTPNNEADLAQLAAAASFLSSMETMDTVSVETPGGRKLKHRYDESLEEVTVGKSCHQATKMLSIEESVHLMREQKKTQELLAAHQAAAKLGSQLGIKMQTFNPEGTSNMTYRDTGVDDEDVDDSKDSDDEAEMDYPD